MFVIISCFFKEDDETDDERAREVSYLIALELVKAAHSFSDGELIKKCLVIASSVMSPSVTERYQSIPLSRRTVTRRIKDMGDNVKTQLRKRAEEFVWYSLALDESTDVTDISQLAIFIRGVDQNMNITEELLDMIPMHDTTTAQDLFECVESALKDLGLPWQKLCSVATDGAAAMVGVKAGLVKLIKDKVKSFGVKDEVLGIHCIIHRENLCARTIKLKNVMEIVIKVINSIRSSALSHRQFKSLCDDFGSIFSDVSYYCEVRWLSRGLALERFFCLLEEIATFMELKGKPVPQLRDDHFALDLAFLADMCKHLNVLNTMLQGGSKLITDLFDCIKGFKETLSLFEDELKTGKCDLFPHLKEVIETRFTDKDGRVPVLDFDDYIQVVQNLKQSFTDRFADMEKLDPEFQVFAAPFSVNPSSASNDYKVELIYLQNDRILKEKYRTSTSVVHFYEGLSDSHERFPQLCKLACRMISMFGTTYLCESTFSLMKITKSRFRSALSNEHLSASLRLMCTNFRPDITYLCKRKNSGL